VLRPLTQHDDPSSEEVRPGLPDLRDRQAE